MKLKAWICYSLVIFLVGLALPASHSHAKCFDRQVVVLGDSLVAGYGLDPGEAYPEQLEKALHDAGIPTRVINAGVSGDTTSGGLARLDWSVGEDAELVIVELGANDALRGIPLEVTRSNLDAMIERLKARGISVILAGMLAPPNMGEKYGNEFQSIYEELADKHEVVFYPFFLDGVAADPALNLDDGIHPTAEGISIIVTKTLPLIAESIGKLCKG